MKVVEPEEKLIPNRPETAKITPEVQDDLWVLYNLISPGDTLSADTLRVKCFAPINIKITALEQYDKESSTLRIKGKIVGIGEFHTIAISLNKPFLLRKKSWDSRSIETLRSAGCGPRPLQAAADIGVLLMNPSSARMYLVGKSTLNLCASVGCGYNNNKGNSDFLDKVFGVFRNFVDFSVLRCMVIGGSGSTKYEFRRYMLSESKRLRLRCFEDNKSRIVLVEVDDINKEGLKEVLCDGRTMSLIKDTKFAMEVRAMKELNDLVNQNSDRACYGPKSVEAAQEMRAIDTLLITDELYKSRDDMMRHKYIELVNSVRESGGKVLVYSSPGHVSGEKLAQFSGVAAILRFPLPDIQDL